VILGVIDFKFLADNCGMTLLNAVARRIDITHKIPAGYTHINAVTAAREVLGVMGSTKVARGILRRSRRYPPSTNGILILNGDAISAFTVIYCRHRIATSIMNDIWKPICFAVRRDGLPEISAQESARLIAFWINLPEVVGGSSDSVVKNIMHANLDFAEHLDKASLEKLIPRVAEMLLHDDFCLVAGTVLAKCALMLERASQNHGADNLNDMSLTKEML
jgi:hypothetical protein